MTQSHLAKLQCTVCKSVNYHTRWNNKSRTAQFHEKKLNLKKFCKKCAATSRIEDGKAQAHTPHKQTKK